MSFVLNLTSTSASGREIVRTRRVERDVLTIGRDPASDIHLTDLEITHHHAEIRRLAPDRVAVRAVAAIPLLVDGLSTEEAEIDPARGGEIRIGETRITIAAGEEAGTIAIGVTRDSEPLEGADEAAKRFSVAGLGFGKRTMAWAFGLAILAIFLVWPIASYQHAPQRLTDAQLASNYRHIGESWNSGPLSKGHAALVRNCKACHVDAFVAVPDRACAACHDDLGPAHADPRKLAVVTPRPAGLRGLELSIAEKFGRDSGRCVNCHREHSGPTPMPAARVSCTDCHANLKAKLPATALANVTDFGKGHPEFKPQVMTSPGDYPRFTTITLGDPNATPQNSGLTFPHALHMARDGGVARMQLSLGRGPLACVECHVADESGARFRSVVMERNCAQCHSLAFDRVGGAVRNLPHGDVARTIAFIISAGGRMPSMPLDEGRDRPGTIAPTPIHYADNSAAARVRATFSPNGACHDCHVVIPPAPGSINYRIVPVREQLRFMSRGWFDHKAHSKDCASCHSQALTTNDSRVLMLPGIATCRQCHGGADAKPPLIRSTCAMCHAYHHGSGEPQAVRPRALALWAPPRSWPQAATDGRGKNADRPDFRSSSWVRPGRSRGNERAPP